MCYVQLLSKDFMSCATLICSVPNQTWKPLFELGVVLFSPFQELISLLKMQMTKLPTLVGHLEVTGYLTGVKERTAHHLKMKLLKNILLNVKPLVSKWQIHNDVNSDSEGGSEILHFLSPHRSQQLLSGNCCGLVTPCGSPSSSTETPI